MILSLGRLFQIPLHGDMCRTGRLTGRCPCLVTVDPVIVTVIRIPFIFCPFYIVRQLLLRILHLFAVLCAELLPEFYRARRTILHAASAGHAFFLIHMGHIGGPGHIRRIEKLRSPQCVTDIHIAVADAENLILPVDIGDLMHKTVLFRSL